MLSHSRDSVRSMVRREEASRLETGGRQPAGRARQKTPAGRGVRRVCSPATREGKAARAAFLSRRAFDGRKSQQHVLRPGRMSGREERVSTRAVRGDGTDEARQVQTPRSTLWSPSRAQSSESQQSSQKVARSGRGGGTSGLKFSVTSGSIV